MTADAQSSELSGTRRGRVVGMVAAAWAACITLGAIAVNVVNPRQVLVRTLLDSEPVHIVAHLFLYGVLAGIVAIWSDARTWVVVTAVMAAGLVQEASQTLLFGRPMGGPELFDLAVDFTAVLLALALRRLWRSTAPR